MLVLPKSVRDELEAWIGRGYPEETCGLLIGRTELGRTETASATRAKNLNRERARDRYDLDPLDYIAADSAARSAGFEIVGVWHSHPDHPAEPSETDRAAAWEGWSYVIVEVTRNGVRALRSWRLAGERFVEEPVSGA
jgi:proteasome lid subunit RPN8/RPN11